MITHAKFPGPIVTVVTCFSLACCDKENKLNEVDQGNKLSADSRSRLARPAHSERNSNDISLEIVSRIRDGKRSIQPNEVGILRKDLEQYLLGSDNQDEALNDWLDGCLKSIAVEDRDRVAAALLIAVNDLVYEAGGNYIEKNFSSSENRLRTLVSWFTLGLERKDTKVFSLLAKVQDPADQLIYAEAIGGNSAVRLGNDGRGLDWLVANAPSNLLAKMFSGYLGAAPNPPSEGQVIDLINNPSLSDESRSELMIYYVKSIASADSSRAIDFLSSNKVVDQSIWKAAIDNIGNIDFSVYENIYSKIPDSMAEEKSQLQVKVVKSQGIGSIAPFLLSGGKASPQLISTIATSLVTKGNFDEDLLVIRQMPDQESKKLLLANSVTEGVLNGIGEGQLALLSRELNDQEAYKLSLRKAAAVLNKINTNKRIER